MTGTSIDAIDIAAVCITGRGLTAHAKLRGLVSASFGDLATRLRSAHRQDPMSAHEFASLSRDLAIAHLAPLHELAREHGTPDLIALHGQTLFHQPPLSLQLINASVVAQELGCEVVSNLRAVDIAAGGQGAPITPLADWMLFRSKRACRVIVNLGGFSNATVLPPEPPASTPSESRAAWISVVRGFDLCLCNQLLDHLARTRGGIPFDRGGNLALSGRTQPAELQLLHALLDAQRRADRSLGTADEILSHAGASLAALSPADALATAVEAIARTIATAVRAHLTAVDSTANVEVLIAGGGARNEALVAALGRCAELPVLPTDCAGCPSDARECVAMAVLGALAQDGVSITLPQVTRRGPLRAVDGEFVRSIHQ